MKAQNELCAATQSLSQHLRNYELQVQTIETGFNQFSVCGHCDLLVGFIFGIILNFYGATCFVQIVWKQWWPGNLSVRSFYWNVINGMHKSSYNVLLKLLANFSQK